MSISAPQSCMKPPVTMNQVYQLIPLRRHSNRSLR